MKAQYIIDDANCGFVGINKNLEISGGYDQQYWTAGANPERMDWIDEDVMEAEEKRKLADIMIARWQRYMDVAV